MPHFKTFFDRDFLAAADLLAPSGKPLSATVTIETVTQGELRSKDKGKKKRRAPVISFVGRQKKFVACTTNCETIAGMYGPLTQAWHGKRITLYATKCDAFGKITDCIRVKPTIPPTKAADSAEQVRTPEIHAELTGTLGADPHEGMSEEEYKALLQEQLEAEQREGER